MQVDYCGSTVLGYDLTLLLVWPVAMYDILIPPFDTIGSFDASRDSTLPNQDTRGITDIDDSNGDGGWPQSSVDLFSDSADHYDT